MEILDHLASWEICMQVKKQQLERDMENSAVATGLEKVSFIPIPKIGNAKVC